MKIATGIAFVALLLALPAAAQPVPPAYDDEPEVRGRSAEFREAYRRAYERGFERGYAKGLADGERRGAVVAPAPAPAPRTGPIRITGAVYGTSSRNCDGTRWLAHRANGKRSYSVEITNDICGDPARGDRKSLDVSYYCGEIEKTASANEHRTIYLSCAS
jgi:hypothetical protein